MSQVNNNNTHIYPPSSPSSPSSIPNNMLSMTLWNSNGCARHTIEAITNSLPFSHLLFLTETWLLSPLRYLTNWKQYHTYAVPVDNTFRGEMGISLLVHPDCPYEVTHFPSTSPYVLTCQVSNMLIHCIYLPPALSVDEAIEVLDNLPVQTHPSQHNTIICGDFNARHRELLGDTRTTPRGTALNNWIVENGLRCWNSELAFGIPTYYSHTRFSSMTGRHFHSVIDLFLSTQDVHNAQLRVHDDLALGSDHSPLTLSCLVSPPSPPPPPPDSPSHPRLLWNLSRLSDDDCTYVQLFKDKIQPFHQLLQEYTSADGAYTSVRPDLDALTLEFTAIIQSSLDQSVGRKNPHSRHHAWFWTADLQTAFDHREFCRRAWKRASGPSKAARWTDYTLACSRYKSELRRRRRFTWKQFCHKLSYGPLADTNSIVSRIRRNRVVQPQFSHPEGSRVAASVMARHLQQVFSGANLPDTRYSAPPILTGPHSIDEASCPITTSTVHYALLKRLSRRKAPGVDHLRTEMLLPIADEVIPTITLLFQLCWKWSVIPSDWCTAQVVPIYKKGDALDPGNYRPISLTSIMRKLFELCLQQELESTAPPLDPVQGGFRHHRSALDQALCLHELCRQHTIDHSGEPPVLAFLDIKSAYDTVDRAIVWRALETHVSEPMLGILQCLFDQVSIEVLLGGYASPSFRPRTGVLQGSILSPFLYSVYINSLPAVLRDIRLPVSARYYSTMPQREFGGLWINCLLYADDVVLIAAPEVMPRLLKKAEEHSQSLGYRWNPAKCVVLNCPSDNGGRRMKLYGSPIPKASSFAYLGVPFSPQGKIATDLLIRRNTASAISAMRATLLPIGIRSASFSRLIASRLYTTFIRPKFEYGLCICTFLVKQLALFDVFDEIIIIITRV